MCEVAAHVGRLLDKGQIAVAVLLALGGMVLTAHLDGIIQQHPSQQPAGEFCALHTSPTLIVAAVRFLQCNAMLID
jgi:hypothetical protein